MARTAIRQYAFTPGNAGAGTVQIPGNYTNSQVLVQRKPEGWKSMSPLAEERLMLRDPVNLIRLFWLADRHNLAIHPDAKRLANRSLRLVNPSLRELPRK